MDLNVLYSLFVLALLAGGAVLGMRYAQIYVQAIHNNATPNWSMAAACVRALKVRRTSVVSISWDLAYLMLVLGWVLLSQTLWVKALLILLLMPLLTALWRIDKHSYLLPDALLLGVLFLGIVYAYTEGALVSRLIAASSVYLVLRVLCWAYERLSAKPSMGAGDTKLITVFCLWLGSEYLLAFIFTATLLLLAAAVLQAKKKQCIAFGPYLIMAGVLMLALDKSIFA